MIDGGVVVGFLIAYLTRKATVIGDRVEEDIDGKLEELYNAVKRRFSGSAALNELELRPKERETEPAQTELARAITIGAENDPAFGQELHRLLQDLDLQELAKPTQSATAVRDQVITADRGSVAAVNISGGVQLPPFRLET